MVTKTLVVLASALLTLSAAPQTMPAATSSAVTVINVTAFGAKGDGVTVDRPATAVIADTFLDGSRVALHIDGRGSETQWAWGRNGNSDEL